jgi:hypothetical protein
VARGIPEIRILTRFHSMAVGHVEIKSEIMALNAWCEIRFPIREHGMNYESQPLQAHEISSMKADDAIIQRVIRAYSLMLDFYGMRLVTPKTGLLDRSLPPRNYANRYRNLISECHFMPGVQFTQSIECVGSPHNYLRISRILKCLSEFGLEHLNSGFLLHILSEQSESHELDSPQIRSSMDRWWANCLRNEEEREWLGEVIRKVRMNDGYVFTREMYEAALERRARSGSLKDSDENVHQV